MILKPKKTKSDTVSTVSPSISHEVMGPDAMILVFIYIYITLLAHKLHKNKSDLAQRSWCVNTYSKAPTLGMGERILEYHGFYRSIEYKFLISGRNFQNGYLASMNSSLALANMGHLVGC